MKTTIVKPTAAFWIGVLLTFPAFYFVTVSLLKYGLSVAGPFDAVEPLMNRWGAKEPLGLNINAVIVFGPLLALLINLSAIVQLTVRNEVDHWQWILRLEKRRLNWFIVLLASLLLATLFFYLLGENCRC